MFKALVGLIMAKWLEADGFGPEPGWPDKGHDGSQEAGAVEKVGASGSEGPEKGWPAQGPSTPKWVRLLEHSTNILKMNLKNEILFEK